MAKCGAVSTYSEDGQEWAYHCDLESGHSDVATVVGDDGDTVTVTTPTPHDYVLDSGQTPPPEPVEA